MSAGFYEARWWKDASSVLKVIEQRGFEKLGSVPFDIPWPGNVSTCELHDGRGLSTTTRRLSFHDGELTTRKRNRATDRSGCVKVSRVIAAPALLQVP